MVFAHAISHVPTLLAVGEPTGPNALAVLGTHLLAAVVFSIVGIAVLWGFFMLMKKMCPFSIIKEIEEDQNTAVAIIIGSIILGIAIIIAAAIQG